MRLEEFLVCLDFRNEAFDQVNQELCALLDFFAEFTVINNNERILHE